MSAAVDLRYYAYCLPAVAVMTAWELLYSSRQPESVYTWKDVGTNLGCGAGAALSNVLLGTPMLAAYVWIYQHWSLSWLGERPVAAAVAAFFGGELTYYWFHRASHRVGVLWASHVVHHQSGLFNVSVSVRQSWLEGMFRWPSNFVLAAIGVPPETLLAYVSLSLMYQIWLHTRSIGALPWLEGFLNTPALHRVHHGATAPHLDKNFGATLIIWDRLFGTYEREGTQPVVFGTVTPFVGQSPIKANTYFWGLLRQVPWRLWLQPPEVIHSALDPGAGTATPERIVAHKK